MNNCVLIGRLTRDPELRYLPGNGTPLTKFNLAVDRNLSKEKKQEFESQGKQTADFINITVWGKMGESCANYLAKGRLVGVQGRIQSGSYTKDDGTRVYTTEVVANNVEFLEWKDKSNQQDKQQDSSIPDGFMDYSGSQDDIPF